MKPPLDSPRGRSGLPYNPRIAAAALQPAMASTLRKGRPSGDTRVRLHIGDVAASREPVVLHTLLGSCVAVCMYDPLLRAGGMNHILLPDSLRGDTSTRWGVHAMELLINKLMNLGGDRRTFMAKAFGGANIIKGMTQLPIGDANTKFVREFLATERIPLIAERLGGDHAVHLNFRTDTGKATVHTVDGSNLPRIVDAESSHSIAPRFAALSDAEITLF